MGLLSRLLKNNKEDKNTTKIESTGESFLPSEQVDTDQEKKAEVPPHPESTRFLALRANGVDELFEDVGRFVIKRGKASIGMVQREYKLGFNRAARILDQLSDAGVVGADEGTRPRTLLMDESQFEVFVKSNPLPIISYSDRVVKTIEQMRESIERTEKLRRNKEYVAQRTEELIALKFAEKRPVFSMQNVLSILKMGNCIVDSCDYDTPLDFSELILSRCGPNDAGIVMIDTDIGILKLFKEFPSVILADSPEKGIRVLRWLVAEQKRRQEVQIGLGLRQYMDFFEGFASENRFNPYFVIIREMKEILDDSNAFECLEHVLVNSERFGIIIIAFSQYRLHDLRLGTLRRFLHQKSSDWILSVFNNPSQTELIEKRVELDEMNGIMFERFCASLLQRNGYSNVNLTKQSGDMGGDILAEKEQVKYVIQCKRYDSSVGVSAIQEVIGSRSVYNCHVSHIS